MFSQYWEPCDPVKLTHKMNHHTSYFHLCYFALLSRIFLQIYNPPNECLNLWYFLKFPRALCKFFLCSLLVVSCSFFIDTGSSFSSFSKNVTGNLFVGFQVFLPLNSLCFFRVAFLWLWFVFTTHVPCSPPVSDHIRLGCLVVAGLPEYVGGSELLWVTWMGCLVWEMLSKDFSSWAGQIPQRKLSQSLAWLLEFQNMGEKNPRTLKIPYMPVQRASVLPSPVCNPREWLWGFVPWWPELRRRLWFCNYSLHRWPTSLPPHFSKAPFTSSYSPGPKPSVDSWWDLVGLNLPHYQLRILLPQCGTYTQWNTTQP